MFSALKPQSFKPESRLGARDPAVAEEAAYQTGLDTSMLMCPPIVRHANDNITEEDTQSNRYETADKTTYFFSRLVIHFVAVFFKKSGAVQHLKDFTESENLKHSYFGQQICRRGQQTPA